MNTKIRVMLALFSSLILVPLLGADASADSEAENRSAVENSFVAWRAGTGSPFGLLAENAVWTVEGLSSSAGSFSPDELKALIAPFNAALSRPLVPTVPTINADGDMVIARFKASAPLKSGGTYRNTYAWFLRFQDGKIVEVNAFLDLGAFEDVIGR